MPGYYSSVPAPGTVISLHQPNNSFPDYEQNDKLEQPLSYLRPIPSAHSPFINTPPEPLRPMFHRPRRCMDYGTTVILILVWSFLLLSSIVLLGITDMETSTVSDDGATATADQVAFIIAVSSVPILIATVLNEVLVDRCWRRVVYSALGKKIRGLSNKQLARRLRAANFEWLSFVKRLFRCRVSLRELRSFASYALLRWGTAISIASVQFCVSWKLLDSHSESIQYSIHKRYIWLIGPIVLHGCSIFGITLIWIMPPWKFFSDRFNDHGLLWKYTPYLQRIHGGSIAGYEAVAACLETHERAADPLTKKNEPGVQVKAKLSGVWFGLLTMCIPPILAGVFFRYTSHRDVLTIGTYRFVFHFVFLAQNILYILALDFVVWNVSLEGFCKRDGARPNKTLRHLGYSSGIMLLAKAVRQRKPVRAIVFIWLFWIQASLVRFLTVLYTLCINVLSYGSYSERADFYDPTFWIAWAVMTVIFVFPLFFIWIITKSEAPVSKQDGWRWAQIAQHAMNGPGFYGVRDGRAVWDVNVEPFTDHAGKELK